MGFFSNLLRPDKQFQMMATAPFERRTDMPWLQGTVRNLAHGVVGDEGASNFEQRYLGDTANGYYKPEHDPANQSPMQSGLSTQQQQQTSSTSSPAQTALEAWLKLKQQQGAIQ